MRDDYNKAHELILRIGKKGEYVDEHAYHTWPLFLKFRESEQFLVGYEAVYGYPFSNQLKKVVEESQADVDETIILREEELQDTRSHISSEDRAECVSTKIADSKE